MNSLIGTSTPWRGRVAKALLSLVATLLIPLAVNAAPPGYIQTNLVSDGVVPAVTIDPNLKNPWGIAFFSGLSPFWIADNGSGVSTLYDGTGIPFAALPVVDIPLPSGIAPGGASTGLVANTLAFTDVPLSRSMTPAPRCSSSTRKTGRWPPGTSQTSEGLR